MRARTWRSAAASMLVAGLVVGVAGPASAKSFRFPEVRIDVEVRADGSFRVREERTFEFDGSFRRAFINVRNGAYTIEDPQVSEGGVPYRRVPSPGAEVPGTFVAFPGSQYEIRWFYDANGGRRTFTISYVVRGAIVRYPDVAELEWQFIGSGWDAGTDRADILVRLPAGARRDEIRVWGHGPLQGEARIESPELVRFTVGHVPPRTFVAGRVVFPPRLVPGARVGPRPRLPAILAEEARLAEDANAERERLRREFERRERVRRVLVGSAPIAGIVAMGFFLFMFMRFGREPDVPDPGPYVRELPADYPPAILGYLWRFGRVDVKDMVSTLMDLARRGHLLIQEERDEKGLIFKRPDYRYRIVIREDPPAEILTPYEQTVVDLLREAGDGGTVRDDELKEWAQEHAATMKSRFDSFSTEVKARAEEMNLVSRNRLPLVVLAVIFGIATVALSGWALVQSTGPEIVMLFSSVFFTGVGGLVFTQRKIVGAFVIAFGMAMTAMFVALLPLDVHPGPALGLALGMLVIVLAPTLRQRTRTGALEHARWKSFKSYLEDFSRMPEKRPTEVSLWERYLVYAIPLGMAGTVTEAIKLHAPEVAQQGFGWYAWAPDGDRSFASSFSSFTDSFSATTSAAFSSSPSDSSGGGGGFSGGGGGFSGGGGGGAS